MPYGYGSDSYGTGQYGIGKAGLSLSQDEILDLAAKELGFVNGLTDFPAEHPNRKRFYAIYPVVKETALTIYRWRFSTKRVKLVNVTDTYDIANFQFKEVYRTPVDMLALQELMTTIKDQNVIMNFDYRDTWVNCDERTCFMKYTYDVPENLMPLYFINYFKFAIAKALCFVLTGDANLEQRLLQEQELWFMRAKNIDSRQVRTKSIWRNPFMQVRGY